MLMTCGDGYVWSSAMRRCWGATRWRTRGQCWRNIGAEQWGHSISRQGECDCSDEEMWLSWEGEGDSGDRHLCTRGNCTFFSLLMFINLVNWYHFWLHPYTPYVLTKYQVHNMNPLWLTLLPSFKYSSHALMHLRACSFTDFDYKTGACMLVFHEGTALIGDILSLH